jgi:hypothetical protein
MLTVGPVRTFSRPSPVRRRRLRIPQAAVAWLSIVLVVFAAGCGGATGSPGPSASLVLLDFTPPPTGALPSIRPQKTPGHTAATGSWPVGWDVAFCTAFTDFTVAHELIIDIERAIDEDARDDAAGLAGELGQTVPIAQNELNRMSEWETATELRTELLAMLDLDGQAATAYRSYFNDEVRSALRQARQLRNQVGKQVSDANDQLQVLANLGLGCPGTELRLESF